MFVKVNCTSCKQPFDFDSSSGLPQIDCPHCGKQNAVEIPSAAPKSLTIQHDAPNLSGAKPCPSCRQQIARDAMLCVHCGYNFATGKKTGDPTPPNPLLVVLGVAALIAAGLGAAYWLWPTAEPPPAAVPANESPAIATEPTPVPAPPAAPTNAPTETEVTSQPAETPPPPPPPAPSKEELAAQKAAAKQAAEEELAAQKAAAEQAAFEAKKARAEQTLRLQLASREPLYKINDPLELRRKNGVIDKGTLTGFAGTGTGRVALVATPLGEIGVPLNLLDNPSRRRLDPEYREAFIQHLLSTKLPDTPGEKPAGSSANEL